MPNLSGVLADAGTGRRRVAVPGWHGEGERAIDLRSATAVWRHGGLPAAPIRRVLVRDPLGRFDPRALLCTDPAQDPVRTVRWFVQRRRVEVAFQETRAHLGVEPRRPWSDKAIARATPCLLALFSPVALLAARLNPSERRAAGSGAWHRKRRPAFGDTPAAVRRHVRREQGWLAPRRTGEVAKPRPALQDALAHAICHAA